eukprot:PhM_4_TR14066/c0_g1_i1/m.9906
MSARSDSDLDSKAATERSNDSGVSTCSDPPSLTDSELQHNNRQTTDPQYYWADLSKRNGFINKKSMKCSICLVERSTLVCPQCGNLTMCDGCSRRLHQAPSLKRHRRIVIPDVDVADTDDCSVRTMPQERVFGHVTESVRRALDATSPPRRNRIVVVQNNAVSPKTQRPRILSYPHSHNSTPGRSSGVTTTMTTSGSATSSSSSYSRWNARYRSHADHHESVGVGGSPSNARSSTVGVPPRFTTKGDRLAAQQAERAMAKKKADEAMRAALTPSLELCTVHNGVPLDLYCVQCCHVVCARCASDGGAHDGHTTVPLSAQWAMDDRDLRAHITDLGAQAHLVDVEAKCLSAATLELQTRSLAAKSFVRNQINALRKELDEIEGIFSQTIDDKTDEWTLEAGAKQAHLAELALELRTLHQTTVDGLSGATASLTCTARLRQEMKKDCSRALADARTGIDNTTSLRSVLLHQQFFEVPISTQCVWKATGELRAQAERNRQTLD